MSTIIKFGNSLLKIRKNALLAFRYIYIDYFDLNFSGKKETVHGWEAK